MKVLPQSYHGKLPWCACVCVSRSTRFSVSLALAPLVTSAPSCPSCARPRAHPPTHSQSICVHPPADLCRHVGRPTVLTNRNASQEWLRSRLVSIDRWGLPRTSLLPSIQIPAYSLVPHSSPSPVCSSTCAGVHVRCSVGPSEPILVSLCLSLRALSLYLHVHVHTPVTPNTLWTSTHTTAAHTTTTIIHRVTYPMYSRRKGSSPKRNTSRVANWPAYTVPNDRSMPRYHGLYLVLITLS